VWWCNRNRLASKADSAFILDSQVWQLFEILLTAIPRVGDHHSNFNVRIDLISSLNSKSKIRVILISAVTPAPTTAGHLVLFRHLINRPDIDCQILATEPARVSIRGLARRLLCRLARTPLKRLANNVLTVWEGKWLDSDLPEPIASNERCVVLTVAHGEVCHAARRYALKHGLPLVVIFHDWWPDLLEAHPSFRKFAERSFRNLYSNCTTPLCVSKGMVEALGPHRNPQVLYPIPAGNPGLLETDIKLDCSRKIRVLFAGNNNGYERMFRDLLTMLRGQSEIRLELRMQRPPWDSTFCKELRDDGILLPFASRDELETWLAGADAFLIPMSFDRKLRKRMETSFPSKMIEYARYAKPLVIWGPEYCSAVQWAKQSNRALYLSDENPLKLIELIRLIGKDLGRNRLCEWARPDEIEEFEADRIQQQFTRCLRDAIEFDQDPKTMGN
jgi:hypothetical protein